VVTDGPGRNKEPLGDLGVGVTAADQAENLSLTLGQPGGWRSGGRPGWTGCRPLPTTTISSDRHRIKVPMPQHHCGLAIAKILIGEAPTRHALQRWRRADDTD
jgi:hypothetical protein